MDLEWDSDPKLRAKSEQPATIAAPHSLEIRKHLRAPNDYMNTRILHSGSRGQDKGLPEPMKFGWPPKPWPPTRP